jgi:hypothetical protein
LYVDDAKAFIELGRVRLGEKGELKNEAGPTMLLKINEQRSDNLTNATMFMKTNDLIFYATMLMKKRNLASRHQQIKWDSRLL